MATLRLNGKDVSLPEDPRTTLLDFLHQHLSLFGTKKGCDHGQCGACTVIVDGERVNACLVFAFQLEDCEVTTSLKEDISERMSGNLCRCGAYPNIVDAITDVIALERQ